MDECTNPAHDNKFPKSREVLRPGRRDFGELGSDLTCLHCDRKLIAARPELTEALHGFWNHTMTIPLLQRDYPELFGRPKLEVVKGEGQEPRKPDDPRPNLKIVGWKGIRYPTSS